MNIYLNDKDISSSIYFTSKSDGKITPSCCPAFFTFSRFYIKRVFPIKFQLPGCISLSYIFIPVLLLSKSLTLPAPILFT